MTGYLSTEKFQKAALLSNFTPSIMAPQVLEDILVQRHELVADLVDRIVISITTENKHFPLLIGARGMGKTHLVSIVYNRIKDRKDLQERVIIAWLREEEWGISSWLDLVVRIFRSIGEEYPDTELGSISINNITILQSHSPMEAEVYADSLLAELVGKKTLFLIIENLDDIFDGLGTEGQQRLRAFLQEYKCCTILATTPVLFQGILSGKESFYGWFTRFNLQPFTHENAIELLTNIAAQSGDKELASFLHTPAGSARVRAVHRLAGGNPRVYTLFAQLITKQDLDSLVGAFMKMLDDLMPYYQSRMAMLSPQQRKIVAYLVDNTEAVIVKDIATWCFATPQTISSQLKDLKGKGYVKSESYGKESYYELTEVLMRLCLEVKKYRGKEVESLIEMIRIWYRPEEIKAQFDRLMLSGNLEHAQYYKHALEDSRPHPMLLACESDFQKSIELGDAKSALQVWQELAHVQNISVEMSQPIADLIVAEKFDEARAAIRDLLDTDRESTNSTQVETVEELFLQGLLLYEAEEWAAALVMFDRCLKQNPQNIILLLMYGNTLGELGKDEEAIEIYDLAIQLQPGNYLAWDARGRTLAKLDRHYEAIASFERLIASQPKNSIGWFNRGVSELSLGNQEKAINDFDIAIHYYPELYQAWGNRASALIELDRCQEAIDSCNRALKIQPNDIISLNILAVALGYLDKYEEAIEIHDRVIKIDPNRPTTWLNRGVELLNLGRYEESIYSYDKAIQINPKFHDAWHNKGSALYKLGRYQESLDAWRQAIEIEPDRFNSWHAIGFALFHLDNYNESLTIWRKAFNLIRHAKPSNTSSLIQELFDKEILNKFQQPAVRDLMPQLLEIYTEAEVLPELGVALTRNLKAVMSPIISDYTTNEWLKMWQELGKPHQELGLALKMVAAGVKYKQNPQDKRIFLALPQELRPLLREALGLEGDG
ncbi:tetratricopeptide repeat protein [Chamaesiphon minutus]|uniref:ATPase,tetratricopeptide repeat protein n=1 Tax=Chamaesiphon minutus (strain ATCC 27169 / PCC 6605) TaxID=1173020 RepID=K9UBL6_CHAP6|nr:tetratricopeptide repeat protein [Chamaesiphon minutus]AFY91806.1 ATPase,tetratricopeptide repeat protein [Chamaesiphon minutus PCC 6605]